MGGGWKKRKERNPLAGRLFTWGGSSLFQIGSLVAVIAAYQSYNSAIIQAV